MKTLFIDLDDTLIANSYTYHVPQLEATTLIVRDLYIDSPPPNVIIEMATNWQVNNIKELGYISKHCFPQSYCETYKNLCEKLGREPNQAILGAILLSAAQYLAKEVYVYPGVIDTLNKLNCKKYIVTRGTEEIQGYKIENAKLKPYFDGIEIVSKKNTATYTALSEKYSLKPEEVIMIGDSLRNDIIPAVEAGMYAIHVTESSHDWETHLGEITIAEHFKDKIETVKSFKEIVNCLDKDLIYS